MLAAVLRCHLVAETQLLGTPSLMAGEGWGRGLSPQDHQSLGPPHPAMGELHGGWGWGLSLVWSLLKKGLGFHPDLAGLSNPPHDYGHHWPQVQSARTLRDVHLGKASTGHRGDWITCVVSWGTHVAMKNYRWSSVARSVFLRSTGNLGFSVDSVVFFFQTLVANSNLMTHLAGQRIQLCGLCMACWQRFGPWQLSWP